jgi:hypothetical protein
MGKHKKATIKTGDYEVGYRKPPSKYKFKPGKSPNPSGRGKHLPELHELFARELRRSKTFMIDGKPVKMTMLEVFVRKVIAGAGNGNSKPLSMTLEMMNKIEAKQRQAAIIARGSPNFDGMTEKEAGEEYGRWIKELYGEDDWKIYSKK